MPRFLGLEVQTDVRCASGARVAFFPATALVACQGVLAPLDPESLVASIQRSDARAAEIVAGRVLRTCFSDTAYDREWDIIAIEDSDVDDVLTITAQPIALRMARKLYETLDGATGAPVFDFVAEGMTAAEAVTNFVLPTLAAKGMSWVAAGTIDATNRFEISGAFASILEIVRAIAEPGRANAEWQLRRNGDTDYKLDLLTQIGSAAGTLRVRTGHNLLAHHRSRSVLEAVTRVTPRGGDQGSERSMAQHLWRVASVVSGTVLELEDILGGDDPIAYDDQLNGLYLARVDGYSFSSQVISDSVASTQRVTVASTAAYSAGEWVRVFVGSGANGQRLTSLTNPVMAAVPSSGGLGDLAEFLDRPELRGDCNLVPNPWMRDWSNGSNPPDNWTESAGTPANRTRARETTIIREGSPYTFRLTTSGTTTLYIETPDIPVWAIAGRRHIPALWFHVVDAPASAESALIFELRTAAGAFLGEIGRWIRNAEQFDTWYRIVGATMDLSGVTSKVRIRARVTTKAAGSAASGWDVIFAHAMLHEGEVPASDIEYSGGTRLWQEANKRLLEASAAVRGQDIRLVDLEADDPTTFSSLLITPGQDCELTDQVLAEVTNQRVLELRPNYLRPLESTIRLGTPPASAVRSLVEGDEEVVEPAEPDPVTLEVRESHNDDDSTITWSGGPIVEVSTDGRNTWRPPAPSPITVPRIGQAQIYDFRARSNEVDTIVPGQVTVPAVVVVPATEPSIDSISVTNEDAPCDGGGSFDLDVNTSNMPGTEEFDFVVDVLTPGGGGSQQFLATAVAVGSLPLAVNPLGLCSGTEVRITVTAKVSGVIIAPTYQTTHTMT